MPNHVFYSIDIKGGSSKALTAVDVVFANIKAYNMERNIVWGSGNSAAHERCNVLAPEIPRYYPKGNLIMTHVWFLLGCLFCCPLKNDWLMTPSMFSETSDRQDTFLEENGRSKFSNNILQWVTSLFMI